MQVTLLSTVRGMYQEAPSNQEKNVAIVTVLYILWSFFCSTKLAGLLILAVQWHHIAVWDFCKERRNFDKCFFILGQIIIFMAKPILIFLLRGYIKGQLWGHISVMNNGNDPPAWIRFYGKIWWETDVWPYVSLSGPLPNSADWEALLRSRPTDFTGFGGVSFHFTVFSLLDDFIERTLISNDMYV